MAMDEGEKREDKSAVIFVKRSGGNESSDWRWCGTLTFLHLPNIGCGLFLATYSDYSHDMFI